MGDSTYIYGTDNGRSVLDLDHDTPLPHKTYWDSRLQIRAVGDMAQIGIVPPSEHSTEEQGVWNNEDGLFMTLSREGLNRLIREARELRNAVFGADE